MYVILNAEIIIRIPLFSLMAKLLSKIFVVHQLRLSMEHHMRVSIVAPGWGSVNLSLHITETRLFLTKRERWISNNRGVTLIHWLGPPSFTLVIRTRVSNLEWGPYQKNASPAARLEPASGLWITNPNFYQLSYPGPHHWDEDDAHWAEDQTFSGSNPCRIVKVNKKSFSLWGALGTILGRSHCLSR